MEPKRIIMEHLQSLLRFPVQLPPSDGCERMNYCEKVRVHVPLREHSQLIYSFTSFKWRTSHYHYRNRNKICKCQQVLVLHYKAENSDTFYAT